MNDKSIAGNHGKLQQFLAAVIANLLMLSSGITWGWPSPVIPQLRSTTPPFGDTPMTEDQISWISSLMAIGGMLSVPFTGYLTERIGRKNVALLNGVPHIISWSLIIFGQNDAALYAARLAGGVGAGMTVFVVPLYVSEIASDDIRGLLGSLALFSINIGILFAYVAGAFLSYRLLATLSVLFSIVFVLIFGFMPETPAYLVRRNQQLRAHKSLMFFRGNNTALVEQELSRLQAQVKTSNGSSTKINFIYLFRDRATRRGLIISFMLLGSQQLSGIFAMVSYAETIFKRAGSLISSETAPIAIGVIQIFSSFTATMLMERAGRRLLTLISCVGMTISHFLVGLFFYLQQNEYNVSLILWLPLLAFSTYIINYCLGVGPVPGIVTSEVFHQDVSSFAFILCLMFYWIISFASIKAFDLAMPLLGIDGCFFMLAILCAACLVCCYCLLPETKGRSREDIVSELAGNEKSSDLNDTAVEKKAESEGLMNTKSV